MDPVAALRQIAYYKDRSRHDPRRVMAYRNAARCAMSTYGWAR